MLRSLHDSKFKLETRTPDSYSSHPGSFQCGACSDDQSLLEHDKSNALSSFDKLAR